jgi:hypothetical protein
MKRVFFRVGFVCGLALSMAVSLSAVENRWTGAGETGCGRTPRTGAWVPALSSNQFWRVRYAPQSIALEVAAPTSLSEVRCLPDGTFQFLLTGVTGSGYVIQASSNLSHWFTIESNGPFPGTLIFTDTNANGFGRRFYHSQIIE